MYNLTSRLYNTLYKNENPLFTDSINDDNFDSKDHDEEFSFAFNKNIKELSIIFPTNNDRTRPTNYDNYHYDINDNMGQLNLLFDNNNNENNSINKLEDNTVLIGNKRKRKKNSGKHDKYSDDNIRRTCKHIILNNLLDFINNKIKKKYNNNIGSGKDIKKLFIMNQKQKCNSTSKFNKEFLNKSLKDIFSENISKKFKRPLDHNKNLIIRLMNEEYEKKRIYFNNLFNLTFFECLKHLRGSNTISELEGLSGLDEILKKYENDKDYLNSLKFYLLNFEGITNKKRTKEKKIKENNHN